MPNKIYGDDGQLMQLYRKGGISEIGMGVLRYGIFRLFNKKQIHFLYTNLRYYKNLARYNNVAPPHKTLQVDTDNIQYKNTGKPFDKDKGIGYIRGGDWDHDQKDVTDSKLYNAMFDHFKKGKDWKETSIVDIANNVIENKGHWWGCETIEEVLNHRCKKLEKLHNNIIQEGYKSQDEIDVIFDQRKHNSKTYIPLEVLVNIGRNGKILFYTGHHRMSIAKLLDVEQIPVMVMGRHKEWQRVREKIRGKKEIESELTDKYKISNHPDLQDLL